MQNQINVSGFTRSYGFISNILETQIDIQHSNNQETKSYTAVWDTGATNSVISNQVVNECNLQPSGMTYVDGVGGRHVTPTFIINLFLPNQVLIADVPVTLMALTADFDILVGMDIINLGDFAISNYDGNTTFSFRMPSIEKIDFNPNTSPKNRPVRVQPKPGRNQPCPCGSGKKFKHCCGA